MARAELPTVLLYFLKERGENKIGGKPFFVATNFTKLKII